MNSFLIGIGLALFGGAIWASYSRARERGAADARLQQERADAALRERQTAELSKPVTLDDVRQSLDKGEF